MQNQSTNIVNCMMRNKMIKTVKMFIDFLPLVMVTKEKINLEEIQFMCSRCGDTMEGYGIYYCKNCGWLIIT